MSAEITMRNVLKFLDRKRKGNAAFVVIHERQGERILIRIVDTLEQAKADLASLIKEAEVQVGDAFRIEEPKAP